MVYPALPPVAVLGSAGPLMFGVVTTGSAHALFADLEPFFWVRGLLDLFVFNHILN